jgi:hypothetical protein
MIATLSQYAKHKDGTYVALEMDTHSRALLDHFVEMNLGLTERIDPSEYHTTVIYSRTPVPHAETLSTDTSASGHAYGYEVFPTKAAGKCLVLRVHLPEAVHLNEFLNQHGATSDYGQYKPHVTVCYEYTGDDDVSQLPVPPFPFTYDKLTVKPLDPEFIPGNKK